MRLKGKRAFVTGANSGIGQAIAITFAREGADVAIHYRSDRSEVEETARAIEAHGQKALVIQADFSTPNVAEGLIGEVVAGLGGIDILVNNAGGGSGVSRSIDDTTESFVQVLSLNLVVPFVLSREAALHMQKNGGGSIINITSVHQEIPSGGGAAYCAGKGGLGMVTKCLALELSGQNIRVNNIGPGMIDTPMNASTMADPESLARANGKIPMGRPGESQEIANAALFLASDESSYVSGSTLFVDGALRQHVGLV
ncbi:MAG: glucose 1-dehydrogenase [Thermomicrobiales bacterium]